MRRALRKEIEHVTVANASESFLPGRRRRRGGRGRLVNRRSDSAIRLRHLAGRHGGGDLLFANRLCHFTTISIIVSARLRRAATLWGTITLTKLEETC